MEKENKKELLLIIVSAVLLAAAWAIESFTSLPVWALLLIYLVPYLIAGGEVLLEAAEGIKEGEIFDEDFLMSAATLGALAIGFIPGAETRFTEAVFVMLFFKVGELFEDIARGKSERSVASLLSLKPDSARVIRDSKEITVLPQEVGIGESVIVRPGERIPIDGVITSGATDIDTSALTGESLPRPAGEGDTVLSGCINLSGAITVKTEKAFGESTAEKIMELIKSAGENKSKNEAFISRFASIYTPAVVFSALALAIIPSIVTGNYAVWIYRALTFLILSCPCALVISVPLAFFGGIGGASKKGILIKGSSFVEVLSKVKIVAFDKTGTLTSGEFSVRSVKSVDGDEQKLLHLAAHAESASNHPIASAIRKRAGECGENCAVEQITEHAGKGMTALVNGKTVAVGSSRLVDGAEESDGAATVFVSENGRYLGSITVCDTVRPDSAEAVAELKKLGIRKTVMLTGDSEKAAANAAKQTGVDSFRACLLPGQKVDEMKNLITENGGCGSAAFVGDGINDAPVLALSDVGIAMGALGSDAAIEAADVVLMDNSVKKVCDAIGISQKTVRTAKENVVFALGVKAAVLVLAAFGAAPMWLAVFADVGVTVLAVLNSMRTLKA